MVMSRPSPARSDLPIVRGRVPFRLRASLWPLLCPRPIRAEQMVLHERWFRHGLARPFVSEPPKCVPSLLRAFKQIERSSDCKEDSLGASGYRKDQAQSTVIFGQAQGARRLCQRHHQSWKSSCCDFHGPAYSTEVSRLSKLSPAAPAAPATEEGIFTLSATAAAAQLLIIAQSARSNEQSVQAEASDGLLTDPQLKLLQQPEPPSHGRRHDWPTEALSATKQWRCVRTYAQRAHLERK